MNNAEPISAHPEKLHEQIAENASIVEDLEKRESAYEAVKKAADDVISKAGTAADPAVKGTNLILEVSFCWETF